MTIREMRKLLGDTQSEFGKRYSIPLRTIQNWENGVRKPPAYVTRLLEQRARIDLINRKIISLPEYSSKKKNLPKSGDYIGVMSWLKDVKKYLGDDVVFALDSALMCLGMYLGYLEQTRIWVYGDDLLSGYNGVVVIGNHIDSRDVEEHYGLRCTSFNRTLLDSLANESILDMQGITEALSFYYFDLNRGEKAETFEGLVIPPEYTVMFDDLAGAAVEYYTY